VPVPDQTTQAGTYFDSSQNQSPQINYQDQSQIAYQDQSQIAPGYTHQTFEQTPSSSAGIAPEMPAFTQYAGAQPAESGFAIHHHAEAPQQLASTEPNYAAAAPESYGSSHASGGLESQMHVAPPDHSAEVASAGLAGAAMLAAANSHRPAPPPPAPEAHVAPPGKSGSALGNLLASATGHKMPAAPPQQANHEPQPTAQAENRVSEGGLAGAILNRGKKKQKDAHQQALEDAGMMPGQEDA
jgi:hypothetical protein